MSILEKNINLHISVNQATSAYFQYGLMVKPSKVGGAAGVASLVRWAAQHHPEPWAPLRAQQIQELSRTVQNRGGPSDYHVQGTLSSASAHRTGRGLQKTAQGAALWSDFS